MVNDLIPPTCNHWEYVDDVTIFEIIPRCNDSSIQSDLDYIASCSDVNYMRLNPRKCKELRVRYFREPPILSPLTIGGTPLEVVNSHNVLGVHINSKLKWSDHVEEITKKAEKRLNILRVLRQSGLSSEELVSIHVTLISSILEYCCSV